MSASRDLDRIAAAVRTASGISLARHQYDSLAAAFARAFGPAGSLEIGTVLQADAGLLDRLVDEVAVKETRFLRDRQQLEAIDWQGLLAGTRRKANEIRVWSAGCATGEEAYSLAILACEAFRPNQPEIHIVGTDLSPTALAAARVGRYGERALREVDRTLRERYFTQDHKGYVVADRLRRLVRFEKHNMVTDPLPPPGVAPCSVIVCRNVFIYFEPSTVETVLDIFRRSLADDGTIILGAVDALVTGNHQKTVRTSSQKLRREARRPEHKDESDHRGNHSPVRAPVGTASVNLSIVDAFDAASRGRPGEALERAEVVLHDDPFNSHALFVRGFAELASGHPDSAVSSLRAALYADSTFGLAAYVLGRAHDACGEAGQARRAYEQSLRVLETGDQRHDYLLAQVELGDVAAACRARLGIAI